MKRTLATRRNFTYDMPPEVDALIVEVRGQKVLLDTDLATIYGVSTKALNQAVKRNQRRFPPPFVFRLTLDEAKAALRLRSQFVTLKRGQHLKYPPCAFTEHGALMAATVLNSPRAVQMSIFVVQAFIKMRRFLTDTRELARKLASLEQELKSRLDVHEAAIVDILQRFMKMFDSGPTPPEPPKPQIGFHVKEGSIPYRISKRARNGSS